MRLPTALSTEQKEIFHKIITQDTFDFLVAFQTEYLEPFLKSIITIVTQDVDSQKWIKEYIFEKDKERYNNSDKNYEPECITSRWQMKTAYNTKSFDIDLDEFDIAGLTKILQFSIMGHGAKDFVIGDESNVATLKNQFCDKDIRQIRNQVAHSTKQSRDKVDSKKLIDIMAKLVDGAKKQKKMGLKAAKEEFKRFMSHGQDCETCFNQLINTCENIKELCELSLNAQGIRQNANGAYSKEYIYGFDAVQIAYPNFIDRHFQTFINDELRKIMLRGKSNVCIDKGTKEYLESQGKNFDLNKEIRERITTYANTIASQIDNKEINLIDYGIDTTDTSTSVEQYIQWLKSQKQHICVLTDNITILQAQGLPNNVVVVCPVDKNLLATPNQLDLNAIQEKTAKAFNKHNKGADTKNQNTEIISHDAAPNVKRAKVYFPQSGTLVISNKDKFILEEPIGEGGEGTIYSVKENQNVCFKIYNANCLTDERFDKISAMIDLNVQGPEISWPIALVYDAHEQRKYGYGMNNVKLGKKQPISVFEAILRLNQESLQSGWTKTDLIDVCLLILNTMNTLHKKNIIIGDINTSNILVNYDSWKTGNKKQIFFIDTDSYQIPRKSGGYYLCTVGVPEFASPRLWEENLDYAHTARTEEDEQFAIAVLLYYILTLGESPFYHKNNISDKRSLRDCVINGNFAHETYRENKMNWETEHNYHWWNLSSEVREMFYHTFTKEQKRYTDKEWYNALKNMKDELQKQENGLPVTISNDLVPSDAIIDAADKWNRKTCKSCNEEFLTAHNQNEIFCSKCRDKRDYYKKKIIQLHCPECHKLFTTNKWDAEERNGKTNKQAFLCPDCNQQYTVSGEDKIKKEGLISLLKGINYNTKELMSNGR